MDVCDGPRIPLSFNGILKWGETLQSDILPVQREWDDREEGGLVGGCFSHNTNYAVMAYTEVDRGERRR